MKAYSQDLREHILRAVDHGYSRAEVVQMFGISLSTLKQYVKQRREKGHVQLKAIPGRPPTKRAQLEAGLLLPGFSPDLSPIEEAFSKL